jgi:DNA-binding MarR family transcriptional regulator
MAQATKAAIPRAQPVHGVLLDAITDVVVRLKRRTGDPEGSARTFLLAHIDRHAPVRATDLAEYVGLDLSTVSRHLRVLEDQAHVVRSPDPDDRRASLLALSPDGQAALERAVKARAATLAEATAHWADSDVTTLAHLLTCLADDLENL